MRKLALLVLVVVVAIGFSFAGSAVADPLDPNAYTSLGTLNPAGDVTINTDTLTLSVSGGPTYTGVLQSQGGSNPDIAVFAFTGVEIAETASISLSGSRPLALLSQSDMTILSGITVAPGTLGGFQYGQGPGGGAEHAGGSFGGQGGRGGTAPYGDLYSALEGGSGGGQHNARAGGAGGGAIELGASGTVALGDAIIQGGDGTPHGNTGVSGGAGGSGGGLLISAGSLETFGLLSVAGGHAAAAAGTPGGGAGGRMLIELDELATSTFDPSQINFQGSRPLSNSAYWGGDGEFNLDVQTTVVSESDSLVLSNGLMDGTSIRLNSQGFDVLEGATLSYSGAIDAVGGLSGSGLVEVVDAQNLELGSRDSSSTFNGVVSGIGSLTKIGSGVIALTGHNSYSGGTTVENGTLILSGSSASATTFAVHGGTLQGNTASLPGDITNHSDVVFDQNNYGTYSGNISGSGDTTKRGISTLVLSGILEQNGTLNVESGSVILDGGSVVDGSIATFAGSRFENNASLVNINNLTNAGTYVGSSRSTGTLTNLSTGEIRLGSGDSLVAQGLSPHSNSGLIDVVGGQIEFDGALTNAANTGLIYGRNATMRFDGGLTNDGSLALSFGTSDIYGSIANQVTGNIVVSGLSSASFLGGVSNEGNIQTGAGSTSVFFGTVTGSGAFNGTGQILMEGGFEPGSSPAEVYFGGDLLLGVANTLTIELGGTTPGTEHDKLIIANALSLAGVLDVQLFGGYQPIGGDTFNIFDAASISGMFTQLLLPGLSTGLEWDTSSLQTAGVIQVIPEPSTALLLGLGLVGLSTRRGR